MTWSSFARAVTHRKRRPPIEPVTTRSQHRHPAMSGLDVSPVHGRHCICDRCARQSGKAA